MKRLAYILVIVAAVLLPAFSFASAPAPEARRKAAVQEPIIDFDHKYNSMHLSMKLSKLKTLNKFLPASLRREVGGEYYPEIRRRLTTEDHMTFKEGEASIERFQGGKIKLTLSFPNFVMVIREATWEQIDEVFAEYF